MRFPSPLSNLCDVLIQIQESANQYKSTLSKNEAATRAVLIDPVLRALGWNTANTNMVEVEKTIDQVRADYALYDGNQIPQIIVEAKALGTNLDQKKLIMSLVNYAFSFGLEDIFLTDGLVWEHFEKFQPGKLEPTRILTLADDDPVDCAAYLVQHLDAAKYWPIEQTIDVLSQRIEELENTVATLQKDFALLSAKSVNAQPLQSTTPPKKEDLPPQEETLVFISLGNLDGIAGKKPTHYKLPDGTITKISTWKDVLRESCQFVLKHNPAIPIPYPDRVGRKVSLFSYDKPAKGLAFFTTEYNGKTMYVYVNYDSYNCVENAIYILAQVPKALVKNPPAIVLETAA
jgi:hypothetical protein